MLGFSTFAESVIGGGESFTVPEPASVTLSSVNTQGFVATLNNFTLTANPVLPSSLASGVLGSPSFSLSFTPTSLAASTAVATLDPADFILTANPTSPSVSLALSFGTAEDAFDGDANVTLTDVSAATSLNIFSFTGGEANAFPSGVSTEGIFVGPSFIFGSCSVFPLGVEGVFSLNLPRPADNILELSEEQKSFFGKSRVVVIDPPPSLSIGARTVFIPPENFTVTLSDPNQGLPTTLFIPPENFTVFVESYKDQPTTVFITQ